MFNVGDVVKCIDFGARDPVIFEGMRVTDNRNILRLSRDGAYTINRFETSDDGVLIVGICGIDDIGFIASRFHKVQRKHTREELYSLIGIDGMVDQRESVTAFHKFPCESASLRAPARQPVREMAVGVTVGSPRRVSRGTDGARMAVTLTRKGTHSLREWAAAAQRIGTAEGSGDGSSVRSDQREGVAA